jgi:hypothetical protein
VRLTLRTLLAYLDDTLEPAQAKAIGQKIADSSTAQELIERIKEVLRRRRLTTPPATGPAAKLDVNTVAEYIDSVLATDQLAEVEETCLSSDVYLAEIAACHQILTVVLSEPALVPPTAKQRMYGLVQGPEAIPYRKPSRDILGEEGAEVPLDRDETEDTLLLGLPLYRSHGAWFRRLVPIAGVLLLVAALAAAIWRALPPRDRQVAQGTGGARESGAPLSSRPAAEGAVPVPKPPEEPKPAPKPAAEETKPAPAPAAEETKPAPKPPAEEPKPPAEEAKPSTKTARDETKPAPKPRGERKPAGKYVTSAESAPTVLLSRSNDQKPWERLGPNGAVSTEDDLLSLPGYRSKVRLDTGIDLVLWGSLPPGTPVLILESAAVLHEHPEVDLDVTLRRGRIGFTNVKAGGGSARVRVGFLEEVWELTMESGTEVAVELSGQPDPGFNRDPNKVEAPVIDVGLFLLKGQASLKVRLNTYSLREGGPALFFWNSLQGPGPSPQPLRSQPPWAGKTPPRGQPNMTPALEALSKRLKGRAVEDLVLNLTEMVREDSVPGQMLATYCLGALDAVPSLLEILADEHQAEARLAALVVLFRWIGESSANDLQLYRAVERKYRSGPAEIFMNLLHGFSAEARGRPETYEQLIEYLKSDKLPIRELANWQLSSQILQTREIARRIPYNPAGGIDQREQAYEKWKEYIPDGKLPPRDLPNATTPKKPATAPR